MEFNLKIRAKYIAVAAAGLTVILAIASLILVKVYKKKKRVAIETSEALEEALEDAQAEDPEE